MIPSLPATPNLADVLRAFPRGWPALLDAHDHILRAPSPLSIGERELIAAYVSGLNRCEFCYNAHTVYAESYGIPRELCDALVEDLATAAVSERLRPILVYARQLTLEPASVGTKHTDAILEAGWPEAALMDTAMVVALFSFMNRIVIGLGVAPFHEYYARRLEVVRSRSEEARAAANEKDIGTTPYHAYGRQIGLVK